MMVAMKEVKSSAIAAYGYDTTSRVLAIRFHSGKVHHYRDVPPEVASALERAESIGTYFSAHVRGKFESTSVIEAEA